MRVWQLACESSGAIRTIAALTREQDCLEEYSRSLEKPLRGSNRLSLWSNALYGVSQGMTFFAIAFVGRSVCLSASDIILLAPCSRFSGTALDWYLTWSTVRDSSLSVSFRAFFSFVMCTVLILFAFCRPHGTCASHDGKV